MAAGQSIQAHGTGVLSTEEIGPYLVLWVGVVNTQVLNPGGEALVQPEMSPPLHGHLRSCDIHMIATLHLYTCVRTGQRQGITQTYSARVCLRRQTHLSPAANTFALSCKRVCWTYLVACTILGMYTRTHPILCTCH